MPKQVYRFFIASLFFLIACDDNGSKKGGGKATDLVKKESNTLSRHFEGVISNGMKGDKISFNISEDGKKLTDLTFDGYWRCAGRLEQTKVGPEDSFDIVDSKVDGYITEPPNGGSTAWRFELNALLTENKAEGTFRMNINNLGCDTYKLIWTAVAK